MNQDTEAYPAVVVEIRSSSSVKGAAPGVTVRATSAARRPDVDAAVKAAWDAWADVNGRLAEGLTTIQLKASIEKESQ